MASPNEKKTLVYMFVQDRKIVMNKETPVFKQMYKGHNQDVDLIAVSDCFEDTDAYDVRTCEMDNKRASVVLEIFSNFAQDIGVLKASNYDKYVFVFLSKMKSEDCIFVGNEEGLHMAKVYDAIKTSTVMAGKQKVFIIQADDEGIVKDLEQAQGPDDRKLPQDADRLIIISTLPQILSNLEPNDLGSFILPVPNIGGQENVQRIPLTTEHNASFLIQAFVEVVEKCRKERQDVFTCTPHVVKMVDDWLAPFRDHFTTIDFPLPLVTSTLTRALML